MGGRRRLKGDLPRLLGRHDGQAGRAYRRAYAAVSELVDTSPPSPLLRMELGRAALAWLNLQEASRALAAARRARAVGKGRRPNPRQIERLARRQGLADLTYVAAADRLREMAVERAKMPTLAEKVTQRIAAHQRVALVNGA